MLDRDSGISPASPLAQAALTRPAGEGDGMSGSVDGVCMSRQALLDSFCHDIRTPIAVIAEFSDLLAQDLAGTVSDETVEFLKIIANRAGEMAGMVDDLADMQRIALATIPLRRAALSMRETIEHLSPLLARRAAEHNLPLSIAVDHDVPDVVCDRGILERVATMLVDDIGRTAAKDARIELHCSYNAPSHSAMIGILERHGEAAPDRAGWNRTRQMAAARPEGSPHRGFRLRLACDLIERNMGRFWAGSDGGRSYIFTVPEHDIESLIPLQAAMLARFQSATSMSVLRVTVPTSFAGAKRDFGTYLGARLRTCDLVLPIGGSSWLLCVAAAADELPKLLERISVATARFAAEQGIESAPIQTRIAGSWPLSGNVHWPHRHLPAPHLTTIN